MGSGLCERPALRNGGANVTDTEHLLHDARAQLEGQPFESESIAHGVIQD